jgi:hypothetical protein
MGALIVTLRVVDIEPLALEPSMLRKTFMMPTIPHTPPSIQDQINLIEEDVCVLMHFISNEEVNDSTQSGFLIRALPKLESVNISKLSISICI